MIKVGLTGGYATGKSFVAAELEKLGCHLIYADRLGHTVLEPGGEAYTPTVKEFGPEILNADGRIDRKKLAGIVFESAERLEELSRFVHPAVMRLEDEMAQQAWELDPNGIVVIEAAILIETGRYAALDRLILTTCSEERQIARGMKRDGITREEALARIRRQMPAAEKQKYADFAIDTGCDETATLEQVRNVYHELKRLAEIKE